MRHCLDGFIANFYTGDRNVSLLDVSSGTNMTSNALSLKLLEFWESSATVWFTETAAQFVLRLNIADFHKYYYVVSDTGAGHFVPVHQLDVPKIGCDGQLPDPFLSGSPRIV